jgi:cytochrome P450
VKADLNSALRSVVKAALNLKAYLLGKPRMLDPYDPLFRINPYPFYRELRERDPVHFHPLGVWLVTRYADALTVWSDPRFAHPPYGNDVGQSDPFELMRSNIFVSRNPPDHTRIRKIFTEIFTKRFIDSLRPRIEKITHELLDLVSAQTTTDIVRDLAKPLPVTVIMEILALALEDREALLEWSAAVVQAMDVAPSAEVRARGTQAAGHFQEYFRAKIGERRRKPGMDVISKLLAAQAQDVDFTDDEIIANCTLLFVAGHETTVNLIGSGMLALLRNPNQLSKLRTNPELMGNAIEELLRYEAPAQFFGRMAMENLSLGGKEIKKGQTVFILVGAINRDPAQFDEPERFDIERPRNSHLTFGHGIHTCIGQYLARTEAAIAFGALLKKFPHLRLTSEPQWNVTMGGRGPASLKVRVD